MAQAPFPAPCVLPGTVPSNLSHPSWWFLSQSWPSLLTCVCWAAVNQRGTLHSPGVLPWALPPVQDSTVNSSRLALPRLLSPSSQLSDSARLHAGCPAPCSGNSPRDSAEATTGLPPWYALSQGSLSFAAQCPSLENLCFSLPSFFVFLSSFRCFVCVCILCFCGVCRLLQVEGQIQFLLLHLGQEQKMY